MMENTMFRQIREQEFPLTAKCAYLDTATTGIFSRSAGDAMKDFIDLRCNEGMDTPDFRRTWEYADGLRSLFAEIINANEDEIFFSGSGSDMLNIFSSGIELPPYANVVTSGLSFPSTIYTWMNRVGKENVRIVGPENGQIPCEKLFDAVDENTRVISLCLVENTSGFRHDLKSISEFCQKRGIYLVLDITQCVGALKIDVEETPVDFMAATTYKWLSGAFGIAFGYVSRRVIDRIRITYMGWVGNKDRHNHSRYLLDPQEGAARFETGSLNWIGLKGIEQSAKLYLKLGKDQVNDYILSLTKYLMRSAEGLGSVDIVGPFPEENLSGITYLTFPEKWGLTDESMRGNGIRVHVASPTSMRVSLHYYNNEEDVDKLMDFLKSCEEQ
jgi:cysteine desulfurase/selenocysteine lyase